MVAPEHTANDSGVIPHENESEVVLEGHSIAPGVGVGFAWIEQLPRKAAKAGISEAAVESEKTRFQNALRAVRRGLRWHINMSPSKGDHRLKQVLEAHEMMLNDPVTVERIEHRISSDLMNAEWAVSEEAASLVSQLEEVVDPYLRARAEDIRDLSSSILAALSKGRTNHAPVAAEANNSRPQAMLTQHLFPTLAIRAHQANVAGFATESPAVFSHAAIILKGLGIPVVGNVDNLLDAAREGDEIIVDGVSGLVVVRPSPQTREKYLQLAHEVEGEKGLEPRNAIAAYTSDGTRIGLMANIDHPSQVFHFLRNNLDGIGLFRTEFLVLEHGSVPTEEEQLRVYHGLIQGTKGAPVVIRTFDIGADKNTAGLHRCSGMNPALGVRGIRRHLLRDPEEFRIQIRAILRASQNASAAILFPMVTNVDDIRRAKEQVTLAEDELRREGVPHCPNLRVGAMIEVPSAAVLTGEILAEVDFISVGTNDLLQYFTGADRDNPEVLPYQDPTGSAFRWLLEFVISKARDMGRERDVTICGEIASDPHIVPALLRMGYRSLSISPVRTDTIRSCISSVSVAASQE